MSLPRLVVACVIVLGTTAAAQEPRPALPVTEPRTAAPLGGGLEVGALSSVALIVPAFGGQLSLPVTRRAAVEVSGEIAPWLLEDADDLWVLTQVQVRLRVRARPSTRRSVVVGVSSFSVGDRWSPRDRRTAWAWDTWLRPHAGVSWQWQTHAHVDLRLDVQGVVAGTTAPFVIPRVAMSAVWRRYGGRS